MPDLEDTADLLNTSILVVAYDEYTVCVKASLNNLETTMNVSPISTTRIHKDHPKDQIIRDINSATQTRRMTKISEELAMPKDKYVADILKKFDFSLVKTASTPIETNKVLLNDEEAKDVFQVTPKTSHLHAVKRIFRYLKGQPKLGLWYPRDSPFDLEAFLIVIMLELALTENPQQEFVDQHNMVACLERTKENAEFHQIVDFLTTSSIHYTLTDGITCLTNTAIFENLALMGYESDSDKLTFQKALFSPQWNTPTILQSQGKALQKDTQLPQSSMPIPNVADEAVFKERDDRVVRATTTAASLDVAQASGGHTPGSDEGRPNINELMAIYTNLSNRVLTLEQSKTAQDLVINKLLKKVKRLEKALRGRTLRMNLFKIGTFKRKGLDKNNVSKQGRKSDKTKVMFKDSEFDVLDDAMENVEGGSISKQITTTRDTLNTARIKVSVDGPSTTTIRDIFEDEMTTIADTLVAIGGA
ncbi:hypothetical protein Tco_1202376 [Tanacetum coccineum]